MCIAQIYLDYIITYLFSNYCKILIFYNIFPQKRMLLQIKFGSNLFKGLRGSGAAPHGLKSHGVLHGLSVFQVQWEGSLPHPYALP